MSKPIRRHQFDRPMDLPLVLRALEFAAEKHRGQVRKNAGATPYIHHPIGLASLLWQTGVHDAETLAAAILHDTIEDTPATHAEIAKLFGKEVADIVAEVTDDKSLPKVQRKQAQVDHAAHLSPRARLVKLADKTCNVRDIVENPPAGWSLERKREYFDWAKSVVDKIRGSDPALEKMFDEAYAARP